MSMRCIDSAKPFGPFGNPNLMAKIHKDTKTGEYRVRLYENGTAVIEADYFTDDRMDAENTAIRMIMIGA